MSDFSTRGRWAKIAGWIGALFILSGSVLLWRDSQAEFEFYSGSYEPLTTDTFSIGPSLMQVAGELLLAFGFGTLCLSVGLILGRRLPKSRKHTLITRIIWLIGMLLLAAGTGLLIWDALQVKSFGWFAYAPLTDTTFSPDPWVTGTQIFGKALSAVGLGTFGLGIGLSAGATGEIVKD
ncbi:hypothetical protein [Glutamicibacter sp. NPDC087344]|uniref:hypothetical protein n=1 Tax=Glutamicibacter sp. NPDC087344 TaxID=3363994 RepID=UPI00382D1A8A